MRFSFCRRHPLGYECSTAGDTRFSALNALLNDGRTVEEAYQLDVKGFRVDSDDWRAGKGKAPLNGLSRDQLWIAYKNLWQIWAEENPELIQALRVCAKSGILTDRFASSEINQARALAEILNEQQS